MTLKIGVCGDCGKTEINKHGRCIHCGSLAYAVQDRKATLSQMKFQEPDMDKIRGTLQPDEENGHAEES